VRVAFFVVNQPRVPGSKALKTRGL